jgi:hypothetical protein
MEAMVGGPRGRAETRRRAAVAVLAAAVLLALAATSRYVGTSDGDPRLADAGTRGGGPAGSVSAAATTMAAPSRSVDPSVLRRQALEQLLATRSAAVLNRDLEAWMATVDPLSDDFVQQQGNVFANLEEVPLAGWRYDYVGEGPDLPPERSAALGSDAWVARTVLSYQFAEAGTGEIRREHSLTLVRRGDRWLVAGTTDDGTARDLWDLGHVNAVRGSRSLALGTADRTTLRRYADEADEAARHVDLVWGISWPRTLVVLVPRSQGEMAQLLQRPDEAGLDQIAAVTTGELGGEQRTSADRVVVNPAGFERLGPLGRQVVLRHEITHVATRATSRREVPIWLGEGFADYVAYRDTGVAREVIAEETLRRVREGQPPATLPVEADFDAARGDIAAAYGSAWLAADLIARRWGEPALVSLYRAVGQGVTVEQAFPRVLGVHYEEFLRQWRAHLAELAS